MLFAEKLLLGPVCCCREFRSPWQPADVSTIGLLDALNVTVETGEMMTPFDLPDHLQCIENISFSKHGVLLDLLEPREIASTPRPAILHIHAGNWEMHGKRSVNNVFLANAGFLTLSMDCRPAPAFRFPAQIHDCKTAVRWLRAHAEQLYIDPQRIGVWGVGPGAHLASLLGTTKDHPDLEGTEGGWEDQDSRVQAVVNVSGITDFTDPLFPSSPQKLFGGSAQLHPSLVKLASPVHHASSDSAAFLHLHGMEDQRVFPTQAIRLHEALSKAGAHSSLLWIAGDHRIHQTHQSPLESRILKFFQQQLMPSGPSKGINRLVSAGLTRN